MLQYSIHLFYQNIFFYIQDSNNPIITDEESKENKPLCPSPILEEAASGSPVKAHDPSCPVPEESRSPTSPTANNDFGSGTVKKLHLDDMEMLFDDNTVEMSTTKVLDRSVLTFFLESNYVHTHMYIILIQCSDIVVFLQSYFSWSPQGSQRCY